MFLKEGREQEILNALKCMLEQEGRAVFYQETAKAMQCQ